MNDNAMLASSTPAVKPIEPDIIYWPGGPQRSYYGARVDRITLIDEHLYDKRDTEYVNTHLLCRLEPDGWVHRIDRDSINYVRDRR